MIAVRLVCFVLAILVLAMPAAASALTISGEVSYRERIALPRDATLHVGLVSMPGAQPVVGASARIATAGRPTIAFSLNVRSALSRDTAYALVAEIHAGGRILLRTPAPLPVDLDNPAGLNVMLSMANGRPLAPAADPSPITEPDLLATNWRVTSIGGTPVIPGRPVTLEISADRRAGGKAGCNNYFSEAEIDGQSLTFGPAAATRMACDSATMDQEARFFAALEAIAGYDLDANSLRLLDAAGIALIGLVRQEP